MLAAMAVFLGGGLGALCRYSLSKSLSPLEFPMGTLVANLSGCLLIGLVFNIGFRFTPEGPLKLFVATGFIGRLTTFSTFTLEFIQLLQTGKILIAAIYLTLDLGLGFLLTYSFLNMGYQS